MRRLYARPREVAHGLAPRSSGSRLDATELVHECDARSSSLAAFRDHGEPAFVALASATVRSVLGDSVLGDAAH